MKKFNTRSRPATIAGLIAALAALPAALAAGPSSTNYAIPWDSVDGGGRTAMSASYGITDSIALAATGTSASTNFIVTGGFQAPLDDDEDGYKDFVDNCSETANADQRDTNADGFGNICDQDLNDDLVINIIDLGLLRLQFFTADPDADFNGDGVVNTVDLGLLKLRFFGTPGPSGIN